MRTSVRTLHQIATILLWVSSWNLLDLIIDKNDPRVNGSIAVVALIIWQLLSNYN